jgi:hypothetical protein
VTEAQGLTGELSPTPCQGAVPASRATMKLEELTTPIQCPSIFYTLPLHCQHALDALRGGAT